MGAWFAQWWPWLYAFIGVSYGMKVAFKPPVQRTFGGWLGEFIFSGVIWPVWLLADVFRRTLR